MGRESDRDYRQLGLLALVLIAGLGLTFSATRESVRSAEQQAISSFRSGAELYVDRVKGRLTAGLTAAQDLYDYYDATDAVMPEEFSLLVRTNSNLNQNRQFVTLAYALADNDRDSYLSGMAQVYPEGYQLKTPPSLTDTDAQDKLSASEARSFPLLYTWTGKDGRTEELLGLDVGAYSKLNGFLETTLKEDGPSAIFLPSFPELDEGRDGQVLMLNPFVSKGGNEGLILQLVDYRGLLSTVAEELSAVGGSLQLYTESRWGLDEHTSSIGDRSVLNGQGILRPYTEKFDTGAGTWFFSVGAVQGAFAVDYSASIITFSVCLLLTGLFFFIVWSQLKRAKRVADIVSRRTRALKEAHDELEEHYKLLQNLNKDVEEARRSAELANRAKSEFLATMSHELRTPLNAILGFSQLLSEQALGPVGDDRYIEYSKDIHSSGSHLLSLINDILDLAKLEAGKIEIEKKTISTRLLTDRVVSLLGQQARNKSLELYSEFDDNMPDLILGDELRLRQILINLCSNAIKFTQEGSVVARLFAKPFQNGRQGWVLEVQDTGIGIPEEKQATLFDRFTQVDTALSRRHGGVGLGLAICRELVDRMEGKISVRSMVNVGTAIRVHLPLEESSASDIDDDTMI